MLTTNHIDGKTLFPLAQLLSPESVPSDIVEFSQPLSELFEQLFFTDLTLQPLENGYLGNVTLVLTRELALAPFGEAVQLVLGGRDLSVLELEVSLERQVDGFAFALVLVDASVLLRVPSGILQPLKPGSVEPDPNVSSLDIALGAVTMRVGTDQPIDVDFVGSPAVPRCMIGDTGVIVSVGAVRWLTPGSDALPANTPAEFSGLYLEDVAIELANLDLRGAPELQFEYAFLGRGGITAHVALLDLQLGGSLAGFDFEIQQFSLTLTQNVLVAGSITGQLQVPFFDAPLEVEVSLSNAGDFLVRLSSDSGLLTLEKPGVISIAVRSLELTKEDGGYSLTLTGSITPLLPGIDWPSFELNGLTISSDGKVKVDGGWITLPELKTLDFHGFKIEISQLGFGGEQDANANYNWIGFSGGVQIVSGLPLRGGVEGLKVMWDIAGGPPRLEIGGVLLEFAIEKVLDFAGKAYFIDEEDPADASRRIRGFKGGMKVGLVPLNGAGFDAQFIAADNEEYKFFYLFIDVAIPVGIPILPPALGLYGLAGLFAYNMTLDYRRLVGYAEDEPPPKMTEVGNWINRQGAMAFGAGVTLGTLADNGFTAKAKVILAILLPGPVILIEGYAKILSFDDTYPFRVLAVLDVPSGTFLMNIGVSFAFPKISGDLLSIDGSAEALIPAGDLAGWHLYLGQDEPEAKRLQADVFGLFTAQTYFMVDQEGLRLGVWIGYSLDERYGVLRVVLESWINSALAVSWMPLQAVGTLTWLGRAELSVAGIGLGISVEATASVEVPEPLSISAALTVQLKTPIGKPEATIKIKWEKPGTPPFPIPLGAKLGIEHRKVSENWEVLKSSEYGTDADQLWNGLGGNPIAIPESALPLVPPDVLLVLNFDKSVRDNTGIAGNNPELPPVESAGAYEFMYELNDVTLEYCAEWSTSPHTLPWRPFEEAGSAYALAASFQAVPDARGMKNTKLVLNAVSSLEISRTLEDNSTWLQLLSLYNPTYPCLPPAELTWRTLNFESLAIDAILYPTFSEAEWNFFAAFPMRIAAYAAPWLQTTRSLETEQELELFRCLLILEVPRTGPETFLLTKGLEIHAATHPQAFVQYTKEGGLYLDYLLRTELYINRSQRNPAAGVAPAYIEFPAARFPSWPDKVWITLMVDVQPGTLLIAKDGAGAEVDRVEQFSDCGLNPATYLLRSSKGNPIRKVEFIGRDFQVKEICWNEYEYAQTSRLWLQLPEEMAQLELDLSKGSRGTVYFFDDHEQELARVDFDVADDGTSGPARPVALDVEHLVFALLLIEGSFGLLQLRGLPRAAVTAFEDREQRLVNIRTAVEENWGKHSAQILLPNSYYRVSIRTTSQRRKKQNGRWAPASFTEYMYFKTGNPPGIFDPALELVGQQLEPVAGAEHYPSRGPLRDLSAYVGTTIPVGGPPNEPGVLHYRSYDVGVIFNDSYIEQMYQAAGLQLGIKLLDNNGQAVTDASGEALFLNGWGDNPALAATREETQYATLWSKENCLGISTAQAENVRELMASSPALQLLPQTQYQAQVWAGTEWQIYAFSFLTSRYASFLHHLHDFKDAAWDHLALLGDPEFEVDAAALDACLRNAFELEESVQFEQLLGIFELGTRTLPEQLEVLLLNDKQQSYGLLLESPEPLPAGRVREISLAVAHLPASIAEFEHRVKLIQAGLQRIASPEGGGRPDYNRQWVEVLLLEEADVSGYQLDYRDPDAADGDTYNPYYTFAPASVYPAGTKLIIYNGREPDGATTPTEHVRLYAGHTAQTLIPAGTELRLLDAAGTTLHRRAFFQDSKYATQSCHIVRSQDQTRSFFFIKAGDSEYSQLQPGLYRLTFTFLRDAADGSPVLKRFGSRDPELGQLHFSLPPSLP